MLNNLVKCIHSCLQMAPTSHLSSSDDWYLNDSWSSIRSTDKVREQNCWFTLSLPVNCLWGGALFLQHIYYLVFAVQSLQCNNYNDQAQVLIKKACRHCQPIILLDSPPSNNCKTSCLVVMWQQGDTGSCSGQSQKINVGKIAGPSNINLKPETSNYNLAIAGIFYFKTTNCIRRSNTRSRERW